MIHSRVVAPQEYVNIYSTRRIPAHCRGACCIARLPAAGAAAVLRRVPVWPLQDIA